MDEDTRKDPVTGAPDPQDHRTDETARLTPDQEKARSKRNLAIALSLAAFVVIVFVITVINLQQVPDRSMAL